MLSAETLNALTEHESDMPQDAISDVMEINGNTYMLVMRIAVCFAEDTCHTIAGMLQDGIPDPRYLLDVAGQCLRFYELLAPVYEKINEAYEENGSDFMSGTDLLRKLMEDGERSEG